MKLERIIWHWSAGAPNPTDLDKQHYHFMIDQQGVITLGRFAPESNIRTVAGAYAAHTLHCNTGSIGIALCGMAGAVESPFNPGPYPINEIQIETLVKYSASLCQMYNIPVTRKTVLSHAEVQPTLGIKQRGKWDISWIPGLDKPEDPTLVGDMLRARVLAALPISVQVAIGASGPVVTEIQKALNKHGAKLVEDGSFGPKTEAAVIEFQRNAHTLGVNGIVDAETWAELMKDK